jgi:SpoVK/Ycf46/Vps4 family AAA+-type ATPase
VKGWKLRGSEGAKTARCSSRGNATGLGVKNASAAHTDRGSLHRSASHGSGGGGGRVVSLRESLGGSSSASTTVGSYKRHLDRAGPPPVPYGGGGPPSLPPPGTGSSSSGGSRVSEEEMRLQRCSSLLRDQHDRGIVEMVLRDVVQRDMGVTFDDIAALATAKRLLNEAIVLPLMMPEFFTGIREPWKVGGQ